MEKKDLTTLTKEELIDIIEKQEKELSNSRACSRMYFDDIEKFKIKLETLKNIIDL